MAAMYPPKLRHDMLFHRQRALGDDADELGLDRQAFDRERQGGAVMERIGREVESGGEAGQVQRTPTLFIDGELYRAPYDVDALAEVLVS
jgi:protein-disulfide isomerase